MKIPAVIVIENQYNEIFAKETDDLANEKVPINYFQISLEESKNFYKNAKIYNIFEKPYFETFFVYNGESYTETVIVEKNIKILNKIYMELYKFITPSIIFHFMQFSIGQKIDKVSFRKYLKNYYNLIPKNILKFQKLAKILL